MMTDKITFVAAVAVCSAAAFVLGRISTDPDEPNELVGYRTLSDPAEDFRGKSAMRPGRRADLVERMKVSGQSGKMFSSNTWSDASWVESTANYDPYLKLQIIKGNPDPVERVEQWLALVEGMDSEEIEILYEQTKRWGSSIYNNLENDLMLQAWAIHHPEKALERAKTSSLEASTRRIIMSHFVSLDPQSAIRMAEANNVEEGYESVGSILEYTVQAVAEVDPQLATEFLSEADSPLEYEEALETLCQQYLERGAEAACDWARSIENDELRDGAIGQLAKDLAWVDPTKAADLLLANPGENSARAMEDVMERMTRADAQKAINYFANIKDPAAKSSALGGVAGALSETDPNAAMNLIDASPAWVNDEVLSQFIWNINESDYVLAADAIARIQDEGRRSRTYERFVAKWARYDSESAAEWIAGMELPPNQLGKLKATIDRYGDLEPIERLTP